MDTYQDQISLLHELAMMLEATPNVGQALNRALELMAAHLGMMRGAITVVSPTDRKIRISAAFGLKPGQMRLGEYSPGEGVTGKVIATGKAMCILDVAKEPLFLNRTRSRDLNREAISFICVPISLSGDTVGALSVDQLLVKGENLDAELRLLRIIAAMLAPAAYDGQVRITQNQEKEQRPQGFIGNSEAIRKAYAQIAQVAPSQLAVLLQGESGTGKELAAKAIHAASACNKGPFISLNCAALPENLVESELFGHERGAFTGASQMRKGRFELADGGTIFLDEAGELSLPVQAKLLRVLQEHTFERVGGMETLRANVRVIAASNRNMEQMVADGSFRRDLYYRLNVFPIWLPPLRDRIEDIPVLAWHFIKREADAVGRRRPRMSLAAMDLLQRYAWPGNIRELQNVMERAVLLLGQGHLILPMHLPEYIRKHDSCENCEAKPTHPLKSKLEDMERTDIEAALEASQGYIGKAAHALGVTERVLGLRLARYGIDYKEFRKKHRE